MDAARELLAEGGRPCDRDDAGVEAARTDLLQDDPEHHP
jgi:hypothetical protein